MWIFPCSSEDKKLKSALNPHAQEFQPSPKQSNPSPVSLKFFIIYLHNHPQRNAKRKFHDLCKINHRTADRCFPKVRVQIQLESTVFLFMLAVLENHEIFSSCLQC